MQTGPPCCDNEETVESIDKLKTTLNVIQELDVTIGGVNTFKLYMIDNADVWCVYTGDGEKSVPKHSHLAGIAGGAFKLTAACKPTDKVSEKFIGYPRLRHVWLGDGLRSS